VSSKKGNFVGDSSRKLNEKNKMDEVWYEDTSAKGNDNGMYVSLKNHLSSDSIGNSEIKNSVKSDVEFQRKNLWYFLEKII
jgi:hypothetical protein